MEVIVCSGLLLAFYQFLLARKVPYRGCRRFLLVSALLSVVIPALRLPILPAETVYLQIPVGAGAVTAGDADVSPADMVPASADAAVTFPWEIILTALYGAVALLLLAVLVRNLIRIRRLRQSSRLTPLAEYTLAEHPHVHSPFSFWRTIFLPLEERPDSVQRTMIVAHEAAHIRYRHSRDKLVLGLMKALFWFNPFFWMMERMLSEVQEFEADEDVLKSGYNIDNYRLAIFKQLFGYYPDLTSGLSHSLTKKRFTMMNQAPRGSLSWLRFGAALPLFVGLLVAFGATARPASPVPPGPDQAQQQENPETISVVVNANTPGVALVDGTSVALENLATYLNGLNLETSLVTVSLQADPNTKMEVIEEVRNQLRQALTLKLNYKLPGTETDVRRAMAPMPGTPLPGGAKVQTSEEAMKSVKRENVFVIRANSADRIFAGTKVYENAMAFIPELKDFIRERGSKTIVSFVTDRGTSYACYYSLQQAIKQAYDEVRSEQAQSRFGKAFTELSADERDAILTAVPMAIAEAEMTDPPQPARR